MSGLVIIGAGPAGITAAIEASRLGIRTLVVEKGEVGGTVSCARRIENYPPFPAVSGRALADGFRKRFMDAGRKIVAGEASEIVAGGARTAPFKVILKEGPVLGARAVIIAVGQRNRIPAELTAFRGAFLLPGECHAGANEKVVVFGGGDAAFDQAMLFRDNGADVELFCRSAPRARRPLVNEAASLGIGVSRGHALLSALRAKRGVTATFRSDIGGTYSVDCAHLLVALGKEVPEMNICGTDLREMSKGAFPGNYGPLAGGIFLAGDVARGTERYIAAAVADGMIAANRASEMLGGK